MGALESRWTNLNWVDAKLPCPYYIRCCGVDRKPALRATCNTACELNMTRFALVSDQKRFPSSLFGGPKLQKKKKKKKKCAFVSPVGAIRIP